MKEKLVGVTFMTYFPPRVGYFSIYPIIQLICTFKKMYISIVYTK